MPAKNKTRAASAPAAADEDAPLDDARAGHADDAQNGEKRAARPDAPKAPETDAHAQPQSDEAGEAAETNETEDDLAALPPEQLIAKLQQAQAENAEARDGLLRARAEVENIRRRSQNEMTAARKFAIEGFARELLGVRDNLERAAAVAPDEGAAEPVVQMKEGLGLTLKQFDLALARFAVVEVGAAPGTRFDPECHQAISTAPSGEIEPDHIISVVQKGFLLKERLLRPAMVVVAQKA